MKFVHAETTQVVIVLLALVHVKLAGVGLLVTSHADLDCLGGTVAGNVSVRMMEFVIASVVVFVQQDGRGIPAKSHAQLEPMVSNARGSVTVKMEACVMQPWDASAGRAGRAHHVINVVPMDSTASTARRNARA